MFIILSFFFSDDEFHCRINPIVVKNLTADRDDDCHPMVLCEIYNPYNNQDSLLKTSQCGYNNISFWLYLFIRSIADMFPAAAATLLATAAVIATRETSTGNYALSLYPELRNNLIIICRKRRYWKAVCCRSFGIRNIRSNNWRCCQWRIFGSYPMFYCSFGYSRPHFNIWQVSVCFKCYGYVNFFRPNVSFSITLIIVLYWYFYY